MGGGCTDCLTTEFELNVSKFQYDNQSNKGDQKLYKRLFGNINIDNLKDFLLQHMPATESYCSQRKTDPNKLLLGSDLYPITMWTRKGIVDRLTKLGIDGKVPNSILLETLISRQTKICEYDTEEEFINSIDDYLYENYRENNEYITSWERILNTSTPSETLKKIDGILKGRIKL